MKWVFIRDNGQECSAHEIEFIDASGYDVTEAELLIQRTCPSTGFVIGKMDRDTGFWKGSLKPLHEVACPWIHFNDNVLDGISIDTVQKMVKIQIENVHKSYERRADELEKTKHPKAAQSLREKEQELRSRQHETLSEWIKKRKEAR